MTEIQEHNVPALRFPEFSGEWSSLKLGDIAAFSKGKGISKAEIAEDGSVECIRYGQLYTDYSETIEVIKSRTNVPISELVLSEANDIIIPASGETQIDIATASCVLKDGVALGGDLNIVKTNNDGVFLSYYLNSKRKIDIARLSQGISVVHLYAAQLKTLDMNLPEAPEQQKIAAFLSSVDRKIAQLGQKKALLQRYKKGMMQKLFSQELRFKDAQGYDFPDWEEKRLGEVAERCTLKNSDGKHTRVLTNSAVRGVIDQGDYFDHAVANAENLGGYYIVEMGDFVYNPRISVSAPVGPIKRNDLGTGVMSPLYSVFRFYSEDTEFYEQYYSSSFWHRYMKSVANYGARHDRMAISTKDFMNMPLPNPCPDEQQKIADFLSSIDRKIDLVSTELDHAKAFKKGLLQQMFI